MTSQRRVARAAAGAFAYTVAITLAGCSQSGITAAERSQATTLPTPTQPGADLHQVLDDRVQSLVSAPAVSVDEDLVVDGHETEVRLNWKAGGTVVDASLLPIDSPAPGTEVFRSPSELLSRSIGTGAECWTRASPALDRFDRPEAVELSVLRSARAIDGQSELIKGTVSARSLLGIVGTVDELRHRSLLPASDVQVAALLGTGDPGGLQITTSWAGLVAAAGNSSQHTRQGTWTLQFRPGSGGPKAPPPDQVVSVPPSDPSFASALHACNARIQ